MAMKLSEIAQAVGGEVVGDGDVEVHGVASAESATAAEITFAENVPALQAALAGGAGAVIARADAESAADRPLVRVANPKLAFALVAAALHPEPLPPPGVHPQASVDPDAEVAADASVGPHAVVEAGARIGPRAIVGPGAVVGRGCRVGADSRLHPRVVLYPGVTIGERVILHAGAVIGSDGFGYVDAPEGKVKFPQLGTVVVEDDVEIGANTTIDRAALDETRIRAGAKIDNLVQIAHNVEIGRHTAISAQCGIAGTSKIGERVLLGGACGVADHVTIGDNVMLGAGSGFAPGKVVPSNGIWFGWPAKPIREAKRIQAEFSRIGQLRETVKDLARRVEALEGADG
jgi:UDP-3-O-[3-hydroxymyristoyl] glucosamine N-acyltransferase